MERYTRKLRKELKLWLWIASTVPVSYLIFLYVSWFLDVKNLFHTALIAGVISMFIIAITWFIWAMRTILTLMRQWTHTQEKVGEILIEVKTARSTFRDVFFSRNDEL